jgi:hypothetical protein
MRLSQSFSNEDLLTSAEEISHNKQRELIASEEEHDWVNYLGEMLLSEELEEAKTSLNALLQEFA